MHSAALGAPLPQLPPTSRQTADLGLNDALGVGWALCTMLLIAPLVWWFYLTWLLPAFAACLIAIVAARRPLRDPRTWLPLALLALAYLLVLARMASDRYTNAAGVAATLVLWGLCGAFSLREAGVTLRTLRLRQIVATKRKSPAAAPVSARR